MEGKEKTICRKCQWPRVAGNTSDHLNYEIPLPLSLLLIQLGCIRQTKLYRTEFKKGLKTCPLLFRGVDATIQKNESDSSLLLFLSLVLVRVLLSHYSDNHLCPLNETLDSVRKLWSENSNKTFLKIKQTLYFYYSNRFGIRRPKIVFVQFMNAN